MARNLQDHLAFASYKAKHGLADKTFNEVQAHVNTKLKRRRPTAPASVVSSSSSSSSPTSDDHRIFSTSALASSPTTAPFFSDNLFNSGDIATTRQKRTRFQPTYLDHPSTQPRRSKPKSKRTQSMAPPSFDSTRQSWKTMHNLPVSSPLQHRVSSSHPTYLTSFASTIPTSPPHPFDDDDDNDLPAHSFHSALHGSPPRTPPPTSSRALRKNARTATGEEGADLLLYLATSPSPANATQTPKSRFLAPSTPPQNYAGIPTSLLATPGGTNLFTGFSTPGNNNFNFADFVNVTPSPAQGAFGNRTPGVLKTPREAGGRRRLNFDMGAASPSGGRGGERERERGLGMELGGELVS